MGRGSEVAQLEGEKAVHGMKNSVKVFPLFPMKSCRSSNFNSTKRVLALEVLSCRDLHYKHSLMKEKLKGGRFGS